MPGLFTQKQKDIFGRMSAGERYGQASYNADQSQIGRDAAAVELKRQQDMDDLKTQVSQAQIRNYDRGSPSSSLTEAQFLFPDNIDQQRKHVMNKFNQGNPSGVNEFAYIQTLTPAQKAEYYRLKRAPLIRDTGRGLELFTPDGSPGVVLPGSSSDDLRENEVNTQTDLLVNEAKIAAQKDLPGVLAKSNSMLSTLTQMREHPGMSAVIGMPNPMQGGFGSLGNFPGTDAASFAALYNQFKGGVFMEAYQELKGGGQITEIEGKKAEQAQTIMSTEGIKEVDFKRALEEFIEVVIGGVKRARIAAGGDGDVSDLIAATQIDNKSALKQKWNLE